MAEGARLESVYTATYRGFESPPHRHILRRARTQVRAFFFACGTHRGDENSRPGFDNWRSQLDRPRARERAAPQGRAKRVNPPSPPYFKKSSYASTGFFSHVAPQTSPGSASMPSRATRPYPPGSPLCAAPPGGPKNNKARARPGLAHSMTINNRLSASAGRGPSARSHRW